MKPEATAMPGARRALPPPPALVLAAVLLVACARAEPSGRVIVLGLDGFDPRTVDLLVSEGALPNVARLRREGAYAPLRSEKPLLSPVIWTTIATGKPPLEHGIGHFVAVNERTGEQMPVTSQMRKVKALWNIASEAERTVAVVGWWATWPAESVRGVVVSDHTCYHFLFPEGAAGSRDRLGVVHPPEVSDEIGPLIRRPGDLTPAELGRFVDVDAGELGRPFDFGDDLAHLRWALATADTYSRIGRRLWTRSEPDLLMVYIEAVDSTSHLFGHLFRAGALSGELAAQQRRYGDAVEEMYHYADGIVGEYIDALDDRTTLIVLSDHGFELGVLHDDPSKTRDMRRVSERYHSIEGVLYLYGHGVRSARRLDRPTLLDVAPTVLALLGIPPARDMPGRVLAEGLALAAAPSRERRTVASHESPGGAIGGAAETSPSPVEPAILERLRALGYLDAASPRGDRNLAALEFEAGRYEDAVASYEKLVRENPKDAALRASLAGALGALARLDESLAQLDIAVGLDPLNPEAYHNRGVIHERRGAVAAAIEQYRTALRYQPGYGPSQRALGRLTGSADTRVPRTPAEERAVGLAEEARDAARRGDYTGALRALEEAERLAPRMARVFHYRANVAFLMNDRPAAAAALRTALEIEPDNALFRANLERLEREEAQENAAPAPRTAGPPP
jgi:predicted AlkP superfamily phosphohydrolase/phosphomutase/Flp pilus assembly protein TadD